MLIAATSPLLLLAVLACPVGMGLMMLLMGRGMMSGMKRDHSDGGEFGERSLAELKAEQARLAAKIDTLETHDRLAAAEAEHERERVS